MSKDVMYPFDDVLHIEGMFDDIPLPVATFITSVLSTGESNMVPQKVDLMGRLHYAIFNSATAAAVTDLVFRVQAPNDDVDYAENMIKEFVELLKPKLGDYRHMQLRHLTNHVVHYYVLRMFFNKDFKCTHHPEMRLGEPTRPYFCPACGTMQISGLPHIEDTSE